MTTGKTIALTRWTFFGKVMSLLLNMLSRLVITFLPRSKRLLISWLQSPTAVIFRSDQSLNRVRLFATPWTIQSMGFSRQEYWSELPCHPPGDLANPGIESRSPILWAVLCPSFYPMVTTLKAESEEELKSLLMRVKEESEKVGLKLNIQEMKIMASGSITSWEIR